LVRIGRNNSSPHVRPSIRFASGAALATVFVLGTLVFGEFGAGAAPATNLHCGSVVTSSVTLNGTLTCRSYGFIDDLIIGATNVTLNLGGHTIFAGEFTYAIYVDGHSNVTITDGSESGEFITIGVLAEHANHFTSTRLSIFDNIYGIIVTTQNHASVTNNTVTDGEYGVFTDDVSTSTISRNNVRTTDYGVDSESSQSTTFSSNTSDDNSTDGFYIDNAAGSADVVSDNRADDNGEYGFYATNRVAGGANIDVGDPDRCHNVTCIIP
jgi:parallel beta-helix repeat protein